MARPPRTHQQAVPRPLQSQKLKEPTIDLTDETLEEHPLPAGTLADHNLSNTIDIGGLEASHPPAVAQVSKNRHIFRTFTPRDLTLVSKTWLHLGSTSIKPHEAARICRRRLPCWNLHLQHSTKPDQPHTCSASTPASEATWNTRNGYPNTGHAPHRQTACSTTGAPRVQLHNGRLRTRDSSSAGASG